MGIIIFGVIIYLLMVYLLNNKGYIDNKVNQRLQLYKDNFNNFTKRFLKVAYPYTDYLLALASAQKQGFAPTNLTPEQINFYLSYPKKYEFKQYGDSNNYDIFVNDINLGNANKCWLFGSKKDNGSGKFGSGLKYRELCGNTFFIENYVIDNDFTFMGTEKKVEKYVGEHISFTETDKNRIKAFKNIENESNEALNDCSHLITKELNEFIDKLQEKDYSIKEMQDLYEKNNKKWRVDYFNKYTDLNKEEYYAEYKDPNIYNRIYEDDGFTISYGDMNNHYFYDKSQDTTELMSEEEFVNIINSYNNDSNKIETDEFGYSKCSVPEWNEKYAIAEPQFTQNDKDFIQNKKLIKELYNTNVHKIKNNYWTNRYKNVVKDVELRHNLVDNEPVINNDFRNKKYKDLISRKYIIDSALFNPFTGKVIFHNQDGSEFTLTKPKE